MHNIIHFFPRLDRAREEIVHFHVPMYEYSPFFVGIRQRILEQ
jgi:hypothetical protein